jgi:hypothetical protein
MNLFEIIKSLFGLVPSLLSLSKDRRELRDAALRAVLVALDETYLYYRDLGRGRPRDLDREVQLVRYWSAAAIPMRHVDPDLAQRCDQKAEYWLNPDNYTPDHVKELDIGLESVRNAYRTLLHPKSLMLRPDPGRWKSGHQGNRNDRDGTAHSRRPGLP